MIYQSVTFLAGPGPRINTAWRSRGGSASTLGMPETGIEIAEGGEGRYCHYQNGSIYWHRDCDAIVFEDITICYMDEEEKLAKDMAKKFVSKIRRPKAGIFDFLSSDPLGMNTEGEPDQSKWVGNEGWQILEEAIRRVIERHNTRYSLDDGTDLSPDDIRFDVIDRENYQGEQIGRVSRTA